MLLDYNYLVTTSPLDNCTMLTSPYWLLPGQGSWHCAIGQQPSGHTIHTFQLYPGYDPLDSGTLLTVPY